MSVAAAKRALRRTIDERRRRVDPAFRAEVGAALARHVLAWAGLRPGRRVGLYAALPDEAPTEELMQALLRRGHPLLLPRSCGGERLEFAPVSDPARLVRGAFGALEPPPEEPAAALHPDDLVLVPGVAFDRFGARLGRGGGWYDRSLPAEVRDLYGLAFAFQVVDRVPEAPWDRRVRGIFTEHGFQLCDRGAPAREAHRDPS